MRSKAYRAIDVNQLPLTGLLQQRHEPLVHAGLDVGKDHILCVLRWGAHDFERPWRCRNPADLARLAQALQAVGQGRRLTVALEPTGTYGDALRQALQQAGLAVHRVSPKAAADYAEIFDGVPSQHDGKDAAVVAELAAQGRSWAWPLALPSEVEQELAYQVEWLDGQRRQTQLWYGRLEALLSRHWPEATRLLPLTSGVLRRCLLRYGGPRRLAEDPRAADRLYRWGKGLLSRDKAEALVAGAQQTAGVPLGRWDEERLRRYAQEVQNGLRQQRQARRRLRQLAAALPVVQAMGAVVGVVTACVLWVELGHPQDYHCGPAYRKAMGLNLKERSSGRWQGQLKITKRGPGAVRRWLYLAALRWVRREPVRSWYLRQKAQRRGAAKPALVGVMRKLALALYRVGGRGEPFD
ncbi:MAG TPA: transposase, partial [Chloroflexota bacterium]|nr:transposase [Chloroflexota bacterium]